MRLANALILSLSLFVFQAQIYSYKVKIINPLKKSDVITRELHHFNSKFESVLSLRLKLIEHLKEHVPSTVDFNVGYYEGQQHTKVLVVTHVDVHQVFRRTPHSMV